MEVHQHPFFHDLTEAQVATLAQRCQVQELEEGAIIFQEGDPSETLCLVLEGQVTFYKTAPDHRQRSVSQCPAGTFFGEVGIFTNAPRSLTAITACPTRLAVIHREKLVDFIKHTPGPIEQVLGSVVRHLHDTTRHYMEDILQQEKLSLVGTMMNSIIHDFKNPFTMISLGAQLLQKRYPDDEKVQKICKNMNGQIEHMLAMANELAEFSRGRSTKLNLTEVFLPVFFDTFCELNEPFFSHDRVHVNIHCDEVSLEVEPGKLLRVLQNLIGNAVEAYGHDGTGSVDIRAMEAPEDRDFVLITIADCAGGIPEEIQARLFEPFVTYGKSRGTGLGTAIVKSIIEAHGGSISFESTIGEGTTFFIRLPVRQKAGVA